jgi:hypothetical protein
MLQAAIGNGHVLDRVALGKDLRSSAKVDVGGLHVVEARVVAGMAVIADEVSHPLLGIARQLVIVKQDAVLERLMLALDLALCLGMAGRTADIA